MLCAERFLLLHINKCFLLRSSKFPYTLRPFFFYYTITLNWITWNFSHHIIEHIWSVVSSTSNRISYPNNILWHKSNTFIHVVWHGGTKLYMQKKRILLLHFSHHQFHSSEEQYNTIKSIDAYNTMRKLLYAIMMMMMMIINTCSLYFFRLPQCICVGYALTCALNL